MNLATTMLYQLTRVKYLGGPECGRSGKSMCEVCDDGIARPLNRRSCFYSHLLDAVHSYGWDEDEGKMVYEGIVRYE